MSCIPSYMQYSLPSQPAFLQKRSLMVLEFMSGLFFQLLHIDNSCRTIKPPTWDIVKTNIGECNQHIYCTPVGKPSVDGVYSIHAAKTMSNTTACSKLFHHWVCKVQFCFLNSALILKEVLVLLNLIIVLRGVASILSTLLVGHYILLYHQTSIKNRSHHLNNELRPLLPGCMEGNFLSHSWWSAVFCGVVKVQLIVRDTADLRQCNS